MKLHEQRAVDEKAALDEKLAKLVVFFSTDTFAALSSGDKILLQYQARAMKDYSDVLLVRIEKFKSHG